MQKKLDLECRLEDEQMKNASKEMEMEKDKALLVTRVKQLEEHSTSILLQNRLLKVLCVVCVCVCMTIFKDYESFFFFLVFRVQLAARSVQAEGEDEPK